MEQKVSYTPKVEPSEQSLLTIQLVTGFKGQARVIIPTQTSCYECSLGLLNKQTAFPICTIANTPRLPEHCIEWASVLEWPRVQGGIVERMRFSDIMLIGWFFR